MRTETFEHAITYGRAKAVVEELESEVRISVTAIPDVVAPEGYRLSHDRDFFMWVFDVMTLQEKRTGKRIVLISPPEEESATAAQQQRN